MWFELLRNEAGQPSAIRVRIGGGSRVRGLAGRWATSLRQAARRLAQPARAALRSAREVAGTFRGGVPEVEVRRDPAGRPAAIVLRAGTPRPAPGVGGLDGARGRALQVAAGSLRSLHAWRARLRPSRATGDADAAGAGTGATTGDWTIEPAAAGVTAGLAEVWRYRRLFAFFAVSSIKDLYEGTGLGVFWLFARPLLPIIIGTIIFGGLLKAGSDGLPYFLFYLAGNSIWVLFDRSLLWSTRSLDMQRSVIKKMYFPRIIIPVAGVAPSLVFFGIYATLLVGTGFYYLYADGRWYLSKGPGWLVALFAAVCAVLMAISVGLFTSVWQAKYRDVRYGLRYFTGFWMYVTPVIYPMSQVPPKLHWVIYLNPMAPLVETFKWGLLGVGTLPVLPLLCALTILPIALTAGAWYFMRSEAASVDQM